MKKYFLLLFLLIPFLTTEVYSQHHGMGNRRAKIDQLEKIKLIEELNMSEDVSTKFFARRNDFREKGRVLNGKIDSLSAMIREKSSNTEQQTSSQEWKKIVDEFLSTERMMQKNKVEFISSLQNLLTPQQMAEFLAFEKRFREEIQQIIMRGRQKPLSQ
ncbi:MAG: hypothetical protein WCS69_15045 [Ignavibacteriaceae bacterium]|jgi:hypothetical protein